MGAKKVKSHCAFFIIVAILSHANPFKHPANIWRVIMKQILFCCLLGLSLLVNGCETLSPQTAGEVAGSTPAVPASENAPSGSYAIGKGDVLEITVWREPMLSGETIVRNDGMVSVALLGDVRAEGRTPMELRDEIQSRLKEFVGEPAVTVTIRTPTSLKFYVVGEVRTPGEYNLVTDLTVVQGIARAGGFTEWAAKDKILLIRKENGVEKRFKVNYKDIIKGNGASQNVGLRPGDTIVVP
jgi:polysaccharide export outer membrane protein